MYKKLNKYMELNKLPIEIPADVQDIFNEGHEESEYAVMIQDASVQLVTKDGSQVLREVKWAQAGNFRDNLLSNLLKKV